jgi:hypothetical protein
MLGVEETTGLAMKRIVIAAAAAAVFGTIAVVAQGAQQPAPPAQPQQPMRFFVTSASHSGNLGGLAGADAICQRLAAAAGAGNRTWHAYLSTQATGGQPAVNARDRIGAGPWHNAKGVLIAGSVTDLHGDDERDRDNINIFNSLTETGGHINGRGEMPNEHDMLTGSDSHGRALPPAEDRTCRNWTYDGPDGRAMIGHHDRMSQGNVSWNSSHWTQGCTLENLRATGGAGHFYCFAIK